MFVSYKTIIDCFTRFANASRLPNIHLIIVNCVNVSYLSIAKLSKDYYRSSKDPIFYIIEYGNFGQVSSLSLRR